MLLFDDVFYTGALDEVRILNYALLEQNIDDYDQARHAIFPVPKEGQSKQDLFGTASFYGWSEHVSRQLAIPERANFRAFLLEHGFNLR